MPEFDPFGGELGEQLQQRQVQRVQERRRMDFEASVVRKLYRRLAPEHRPQGKLTFSRWLLQFPSFPDRLHVRRVARLGELRLAKLVGSTEKRWQEWLEDAVEAFASHGSLRTTAVVGPLVGVPGQALAIRYSMPPAHPGETGVLVYGDVRVEGYYSYLLDVFRRWQPSS